MKTTARILWGFMAVALSLSATWTFACPEGLALDAHMATLVITQTPSSGPATSSDNRRQSDELLARARQAIAEGQLDAAEKLVQRAEKLKVSYNPLNPLVDTPTKVRREIQRKQGSTSPSKGLGKLLPALPFGNRSRSTPVPPDPFTQTPSQDAPQPASQMGRLAVARQSGFGQSSPLGVSDNRTANTRTPNTINKNDAAGFASIESMSRPQGISPNRMQANNANSLLLQSRRALAMGDVRRATELAGQAKGHAVNYGPKDDTPDLVLADINKYQELISHQQTHGQSEGYRRQFARLMIEQSKALLKWNAFNEAERLVNQARDQGVAFGPMETHPNMMLQQIANARRQQHAGAVGVASASSDPIINLPAPSLAAKKRVTRLIRRARAELAGGKLASAQAFAQAAVDLQVPESSFAPGEDRPGMVLLDVQKAIQASNSPVVQAGATMVTPATGQLPANQRAMRAVYDRTNDPTRNVQATSEQTIAGGVPRPIFLGQSTPAPTPVGPGWPNTATGNSNTAATLFQQGENALKAHKVDEAMRLYRQAAQYRDQLDPATAQLLQDRLQMLGRSAAPQAPRTTLTDDAMARQQLLARQVSSDIAHQERRAAQIRQTNPTAALALLEQTRGRVEAAGLEPNTQSILLRRIDRSIAEMTQYIEDNRATIELAEQNNQTRDQIHRQQQYELEVQQRLADLGQKFNQLCDEQRFAEAEVIAKQAHELAPESDFANQLMWVATFVRRHDRNRAHIAQKERAVWDTLEAVSVASVPFDDSNPVIFPDATEWRQISARFGRFRSDTRQERTGHELEIERKLKMPVSVHFTNMPLNEVLTQLQRLADVNMYLDPQGLQEEGIDPSTTPVTIDLPHEITLASALNLILEHLHMTYVIKDGVLKITSEQYRNSEVHTVTYDVGDLVVPIPNFVPNSRMGLGGAYNDAMARNGFNNTYGSGPMGNFTSTDSPNGAMTDAAVMANMAGPMSGISPSMSGGAKGPNGLGPGGLGGGTQADFEPLIELITQTVAPETWTEMGGNGTIQSYENNLTLVIKQTEEVHAEIADVLAQLRKLQDLQVTIEVRFITLNDDFFESIRVDFDFDIDDDIDRPFQVFGRVLDGDDDDDDDDDDDEGVSEPRRDVSDVDHDRSVTVGLTAPGVFSADLDIPFSQGSYALAVPQFGGFDASAGASLGFAVLSDIEAFFFINAAQGDSRTNILQAPKVTLFNGQTAYVSDVSMSPFVMGLIPVVGDFAAANQPVIVILTEGTFMTVQAVVSHDRRFVRLTVVPFFSQIGNVNTFTFSGRTTSTRDTSTEGNTQDPDDATRENNVTSTTTEGTTVQLPTFSSISVSTTVSVPDGGTVLLGGIKRLSEGRSEYGTPILNKIPYVNRLFKNVGIGRETQSLMMTVTPRIIILEEEEERIGAGPSGP